MLDLDFSEFPVLNTEHLVLRRLCDSDDNEMFFMRSDIDVNRYLEAYRHTDIEQTRALISRIDEGINNNQSIFWAITTRDSDKLVGTVCLWNIVAEQDQAEAGYSLHPDFQGKGLMNEALEEVIRYGTDTMKLKTIFAFTHKDNIPSARLLIRNGFELDVNHLVEEGSSDVVYKLVLKK